MVEGNCEQIPNKLGRKKLYVTKQTLEKCLQICVCDDGLFCPWMPRLLSRSIRFLFRRWITYSV